MINYIISLVLGVCGGLLITILDYTPNYHSNIKVSYQDLLPRTKQQIDCLAQNIYFEAGREPYEGKVGVAMVTLHRVNAKPWPNTVCEVVQEKNARTCQFSWWCESHNKQKAIAGKYTPQEQKLYAKAEAVAVHVFMNYEELKKNDITKGSYFYHAEYVSPGWNYTRTTKIGQHIYYTKKL
jgi:spore germination cell wall hydrolase CwlJ-like protein